VVPIGTGRDFSAAWKQNMIVLLLLYPVVFLFGLWVQTPILIGKAGLPFLASIVHRECREHAAAQLAGALGEQGFRLVARAGERCRQLDRPRRRSVYRVAL
jgi:hypothetical protein